MTWRRLKVLAHLTIDIWQGFVTTLPGPLGDRLRYRFWRRRLGRLGVGVRIDVGVHFVAPQLIEIADNSWIDRNVLIIASPPAPGRITKVIDNPDFPLSPGRVFIGENVHIAPNCVLSGMGGLYVGRNTTVAAGCHVYSYSHHYRSDDPRSGGRQYSFSSRARQDQQSMIQGPVYVGDYCAVGLGSVILPGTLLRRGCWVACGSVVRGRYDEQSLIRSEPSPEVVSLRHLEIGE